MANFDTFNALLDETLGALEEKGQEEQPKKKKKKKKSGQKSASSSMPTENTSPSSSEKEESLNLPDLKLEDDKEDFEIRPEEEGSAIETPSYKEEVPEEITNPVTFEESKKKIGEEVSESYVNDLLEEQEANEEGLKATVIIHTRTVTKESEGTREDFEIPSKEAPEETVYMPPILDEGDEEEEDAEAALLRQIKEQEAESAAEDQEPARKPLLRSSKSANISLIRKDTGEMYEISGKMTIGSDMENDIVIEEPAGHYISGTHCTIEVEKKGKVKIRERDGGTTNGTFVNGGRIGSKYVKDGDVIKLANFEMVLSVE